MLYCPKEEEKVVKVIFLDIDGVLAHTDYLNWQTRHIDPERVRFLAQIVELTDAQIVLTSTWKNGYDILLSSLYPTYLPFTQRVRLLVAEPTWK